MKKILLVLSNLKHNGDIYQAGTFIEDQIGEFEHLIAQKIIKVIEGAETIEDAIKIVASEAEQKAQESAVVKEPENTWGPKKDPVVAPEADASTQGEQSEVKVDALTEPQKPEESNLDLSAGLNL